MSKSIALAALFAASLAVAQDASVATLIQSADQAVRRGQYAEADVLYATAASRGDSPETVPALLYLGKKAAGSGNRLAAEGFFERLLKVESTGSNAASALTWLANLKREDPAAAEPLYRRAMGMLQPGSPEALQTVRGYAAFLGRQGRVAEADGLVNASGGGASVSANKASELPPGVHRIGPGVTAPKLQQKVEPQYTDEARTAKIEGTVMMSVDISPEGSATNLEVLRSLEPGLDQKAIEAVRQWRFAPAIKDGTPVTVRATIEVNFRLN